MPPRPAKRDSGKSAIDGHISIDGHCTAAFRSLNAVAEALRAQNATVWVGLRNPCPATLTATQHLIDLYPVAIEDVQKVHQRAELDRYGDTAFVVLRPGTYDDVTEEVAFGDCFVITLRPGGRRPSAVPSRRNHHSAVLARG